MTGRWSAQHVQGLAVGSSLTFDRYPENHPLETALNFRNRVCNRDPLKKSVIQANEISSSHVDLPARR